MTCQTRDCEIPRDLDLALHNPLKTNNLVCREICEEKTRSRAFVSPLIPTGARLRDLPPPKGGRPLRTLERRALPPPGYLGRNLDHNRGQVDPAAIEYLDTLEVATIDAIVQARPQTTLRESR